MTFIVDANVLFSAIITPKGRMAAILTYPHNIAEFVSSQYLISESERHRSRLTKYSKKTSEEISADISAYLRKIKYLMNL